MKSIKLRLATLRSVLTCAVITAFVCAAGPSADASIFVSTYGNHANTFAQSENSDPTGVSYAAENIQGFFGDISTSTLNVVPSTSGNPVNQAQTTASVTMTANTLTLATSFTPGDPDNLYDYGYGDACSYFEVTEDTPFTLTDTINGSGYNYLELYSVSANNSLVFVSGGFNGSYSNTYTGTLYAGVLYYLYRESHDYTFYASYYGFGANSGRSELTIGSIVPEPDSLTMFGLGAIGLIAGAVRRRRQAKVAA